MDRRQSRWIERRPLTKRWFMSLPTGYFIRTNTYPFWYIELTDDREQDWIRFRTRNTGRMVYLFADKDACLKSIADSEALRRGSVERRGRKVNPGKIFKAYLDRDDSLPKDPDIAKHLPAGAYADKLTKRLLMSLPTGTRLISRTYSSETRKPVFDDVVPPLSEREGFWLMIRNQGSDGRTFDIIVPEQGGKSWVPVPHRPEGGMYPGRGGACGKR